MKFISCSFIYVNRDEIYFNLPRIIDLCTGPHYFKPSKYAFVSSMKPSGDETKLILFIMASCDFSRVIGYIYILPVSIISYHRPLSTIKMRHQRDIAYMLAISSFDVILSIVSSNYQNG